MIGIYMEYYMNQLKLEKPHATLANVGVGLIAIYSCLDTFQKANYPSFQFTCQCDANRF